jgi:hypothetical protein
MIYGLELTALTSLKIVFIYEAMKPGNILFPLRRLLEKLLSYLPEKVNLYVRKPLFSCLFCAGSLWTLFFTFNIIAFSWQYLFFIFQVAGLNYIISLPVHWFTDQAEKDLPTHNIIEAKQEQAVGIEKPKESKKVKPYHPDEFEQQVLRIKKPEDKTAIVKKPVKKPDLPFPNKKSK